METLIQASWISQQEERLDSFLRRELPSLFTDKEHKGQISNSKIRRMIIAGVVAVNGNECIRPAFILHPKSRVSVKIDTDKFFFEKDNGDIEFILTEKDVIFEDDYIIVVNKPAFLPSEETIVKGRGNMHQSVIDYLWKKNPALRNPPYVGIMHRLDRETSGTLLFTKSRQANKTVHNLFESHKVKKNYRAVSSIDDDNLKKWFKKVLNNTKETSPLPLPYSFSVDNYIGRISLKSSACKMGLLAESKGGQHAHTDFTLINVHKDKTEDLCYFDCKLETGRTHQIRLHLSLSGFPLVGDELYGGKKGFEQNNYRIMLHANRLEFPHPVTGNIIVCEAELPELFSSSNN